MPIIARAVRAIWNWIKDNKWGLLAAFIATAAIAGAVFGGIIYYPMALFALEMLPYVGVGIAKLAFAASTIPQAAAIVAAIATGFTVAAISSIWLFVGACKMAAHALFPPAAGGAGAPDSSADNRQSGYGEWVVVMDELKKISASELPATELLPAAEQSQASAANESPFDAPLNVVNNPLRTEYIPSSNLTLPPPEAFSDKDTATSLASSVDVVSSAHAVTVSEYSLFSSENPARVSSRRNSPVLVSEVELAAQSVTPSVEPEAELGQIQTESNGAASFSV